MISCCGIWLSGRRNWRRKRAAFEGLPSEFLELGEADGSMSDWAFWTSELKVNMAISHGVRRGAWDTWTTHRHDGLLQMWSMIFEFPSRGPGGHQRQGLGATISCLVLASRSPTIQIIGCYSVPKIYSLGEIDCFS